MVTSDDFEAAIFDLDGTLVDSNRVWEKNRRRIYEKKGKYISRKEACDMASMNYDEVYEYIRGKGVETTVEDIKKEFNRLAVYEYRNNIFLKPHAAEFLKFLRAKGKRTALATASPKELYEPVLRHNNVYGMFDVFVTTEEAGREKDFPDVYLLAASKLGVYPDSCAVFEDVLKGIISARDAGMTTVGVYDKYSEKDIVTMREIADRFIMDFAEMMIKTF